MTTTPKTQPEHSNLWAALAAFQADLPHVGKGSTNPAFKSKYADLADIVRVVLPALAKQGLAWTTVPTLDEDGFTLCYTLRHAASGEAIEGRWPLPDPERTGPQQLGSAITYGKRFTLSAVTGIAPDEDDDGNAAQEAEAPRRSQQRPPAPLTPSRDWVTEAQAADTKETADALWDAARKSVARGTDPKVILDDIAAVWRARKAEQVAASEVTPEAPQGEEATA